MTNPDGEIAFANTIRWIADNFDLVLREALYGRAVERVAKGEDTLRRISTSSS